MSELKNNPPVSFKEGVRVLMLINRGVQSSNKGSRRWVNKIITTNPYEFDLAAHSLLEMQYYLDNPDIRLYCSVNPRKMDGAINSFMHAQLDVCPDNEYNFYRRINDSFCSCLMKPQNKAERNFLIDIDTKDIEQITAWTIKNNHIPVLLYYPTPNGWHFITKPFDPALLIEVNNSEVKKDALMLLHWMRPDSDRI